MGVELYWDNDERTVLLMEIDGAWTWDELFAVLDKVKKVTAAASVELGAIIDVSAGAIFPGGSVFTPTALENARRMLKMGDGRMGPVVVAGANGLIRAVVNAAAQLDRSIAASVQFARTADEARALLAQRMAVTA